MRSFAHAAIVRRNLASCEFLSRAEDVIIAGPIGTGKTHLAIALGVEAASRRHRVLFVRAADLVRDLLEARDELQLGRLHRKIQRASLLVGPARSQRPHPDHQGSLVPNEQKT
jgi:DNA replication protein DnaC